ncbi:hypothetical protein MMS54_24625 [Escherichia coli]|nr:hypothetical protein [Escherichia coli]MCI3092019.1 hypothetical protein [Escherichia coli]
MYITFIARRPFLTQPGSCRHNSLP